MTIAPIFTYGILRVGSHNSDLSDYALHPILDCRTQGSLYFVSNAIGYPVAKFDEPGTIIGDVIFLDEGSLSFERMWQMERSAGYILEQVTVELPDRSLMQAEAWHYGPIPRGQKIESGDWRAEILSLDESESF